MHCRCTFPKVFCFKIGYRNKPKVFPNNRWASYGNRGSRTTSSEQQIPQKCDAENCSLRKRPNDSHHCIIRDKKAPFIEPHLKLSPLRWLAHIDPSSRSNHHARYNRTAIVFTPGKTGDHFHAGPNRQTLASSLYCLYSDRSENSPLRLVSVLTIIPSHSAAYNRPKPIIFVLSQGSFVITGL